MQDFSLAVASRGYHLIVVCGLLITVAFLVEHRLSGAWALVAAVRRLSSCVSRAQAQ